MIDVIINETGGLTVAHDERDLDGFTGLDIALPGGGAVLTGPAGERPIGVLKAALLKMAADGMPGRMVRMSDWSLAKISPLIVSIRR